MEEKVREFLVHDGRDNVAVAVVDIEPQQVVTGTTLDGTTAAYQLTALHAIPLGHKVALKDFGVGDTVIKYGQDIGKVVEQIRAGEHVHVHNLKTKRW
jgi:(2R)-sulfolactate sulfo-lyase subunit alpha